MCISTKRTQRRFFTKFSSNSSYTIQKQRKRERLKSVISTPQIKNMCSLESNNPSFKQFQDMVERGCLKSINKCYRSFSLFTKSIFTQQQLQEMNDYFFKNLSTLAQIILNILNIEQKRNLNTMLSSRPMLLVILLLPITVLLTTAMTTCYH